MADNVQVVARFRPANRRELDAGSREVVELTPSSLKLKHSKGNSEFSFDHVFAPTSTQEQVFDLTARPLLDKVMAGFNTTIFAYGQTGSGKSHSMMGDARSEEMRGIIPRLVDSIFERIEQSDEALEFSVKVSYVEIYNERIKDLLNRKKDNLRVRDGARGVWIEGVSEEYVGDFDEVLDVMSRGASNRAVASTNMNLESSRSHSVFIMTLGQRNIQTGSKKGAKLFLVDLAGSEKISKTGAEGQTLKEAQHINKSLSALGNVINALTSNSKHVPYRDSKLTRLLSDSLGGNSKTCLIITLSPMSFNADETLSTCRFGTRAKSIKNKAKANVELSVGEYKRLLAQSQHTVAVQGELIEALELDLTALQACLAAVDPSLLAQPMPVLLSPDKRRAHSRLRAPAGMPDLKGVPLSLSNSNTSTAATATMGFADSQQQPVTTKQTGATIENGASLEAKAETAAAESEDQLGDMPNINQQQQQQHQQQQGSRSRKMSIEDALGGLATKRSDLTLKNDRLQGEVTKLQSTNEDLLDQLDDRQIELEMQQEEMLALKEQLRHIITKGLEYEQQALDGEAAAAQLGEVQEQLAAEKQRRAEQELMWQAERAQLQQQAAVASAAQGPAPAAAEGGSKGWLGGWRQDGAVVGAGNTNSGSGEPANLSQMLTQALQAKCDQYVQVQTQYDQLRRREKEGAAKLEGMGRAMKEMHRQLKLRTDGPKREILSLKEEVDSLKRLLEEAEQREDRLREQAAGNGGGGGRIFRAEVVPKQHKGGRAATTWSRKGKGSSRVVKGRGIFSDFFF